MDSDVEMADQKVITATSPRSYAPTDSQHASPIVDPDADDVPSQSDKMSVPPTSVSPAVVAPPAVPPPPIAKPKSTKQRPRSPSPSPPPPPPPPMQTIRLDIVLGGPEKYEVDVAAMAKATGQRAPTPTPVHKRYESESEGEGDAEGEGGKKKKKKNLGTEYYDLNDPFIDDSELAVDERTYFAQTKQQGFYVSSGEVALLKDKTPKKPKSKKHILPPPEPIAGPSNFPHHVLAHLSKKDTEGTQETPIALLSDGEGDSVSGKRKSAGSAGGEIGKKKRKVVDILPFHPELEAAIDDLKVAIAKESWEVKGKFPPAMKPILADVALKAIKLNEYDDNFFNLMPRLFPYNRFTMSKLIKRTVFLDHMALLVKRQDELLVELKKMTDEGFAKAQDEYERSVQLWEKKHEKAKADGTVSTEGTPSVQQLPLSTADDTVAMDVDKSADGEKEGKDGKESHPPVKRYKMHEAMKGLIWNLVCLSNECCRIENEKNTLEGSTSQVSEQGLRKVLYQKIVAAFPDGWMSSGQISREVSVMKKKFEKEALESES
ncbi:hypothetical protein BV25DRAFT_1825014 [Artomyces pyxidatus]|uniref:Uncharacterized protein n=1 Tax=Artomyces pyxidatus TaxID=48021 RepID=A0ACB8T4C9_9AGAM|nr:hypothetical protein BV25DRAFT_1825014 [Artomyces pyxidatus]